MQTVGTMQTNQAHLEIVRWIQTRKCFNMKTFNVDFNHILLQGRSTERSKHVANLIADKSVCSQDWLCHFPSQFLMESVFLVFIHVVDRYYHVGSVQDNLWRGFRYILLYTEWTRVFRSNALLRDQCTISWFPNVVSFYFECLWKGGKVNHCR